MQAAVKQLDAWHKTKLGHAVMAVIELGLAYALASRAIDTGSWWEYLFTVLFFIGGLQNLIKLVQLVTRHGKH